MIYRFAREDDLGAICSLIEAAVQAMEARQIFQWDSLYPAREDFLRDIRNRHLHVGVLGGGVALVYALNQESDEQYGNGAWKYPNSEYRVLHRFCVHPRYQHQGLGKAALTHLESELRQAGVESVRLDVFSQNPFALALYRHQGYEAVGFADWRKGRFILMEMRL